MRLRTVYYFFKILTVLFFLFSFSQSSSALTLDENKVSAGNLDHLNLAFKELAKSDGYVAEQWDVVIGKSIVNNPTNFLEAYKQNKSSVTRLDALVGNLGVEFIDNFKKQAAEIHKRIKALKSVKNRNLKSYAIECIKQLEYNLKVVEEPINSDQ
ncbi:MAG: hypothetical protein HYY62_05655 [Deltaproteobacteria bacterium]|nr:hypothetical protein [Deltaproteobacteria bacterium]